MIEINAILKHMFQNEPIPNAYALKAYGFKYMEFKNFIAHYQSLEFVHSLLDGLFMLCNYFKLKEMHKDLSVPVEVAFDGAVKRFYKRNDSQLEVICNYNKDPKNLHASIKWTKNEDQIVIDLQYKPFVSSMEADSFIQDRLLSTLRQLYQALFVIKTIQLLKIQSPEMRDIHGYQVLVSQLYQAYNSQWLGLYKLENAKLSKSCIEELTANFNQFRTGKLVDYMEKNCSTSASLLFYLNKMVFDKINFYETVLHVLTDFPPEIQDNQRIKSLTNFIDTITLRSQKERKEGSEEKIAINHELKGHAYTQLAKTTQNYDNSYKAINEFWSAFKLTLDPFQAVYISENIGLIATTKSDDRLFVLSKYMLAIYTALPIYWRLFDKYYDMYLELKDEYINNYQGVVKPFYDIKGIPAFFNDPSFYVRYSENMLKKGAYTLITNLVVGMLLWLQYAKLVLAKDSDELLNIEIDIYFTLKLEEQFYQDKSVNEEWAGLVGGTTVDSEKFTLLQNLLVKNALV